MAEREDKIRAFLADAGWADARRGLLAGDASNRRYERLENNGDRAVLMDAPPERGEDVRPFLRIAAHLRDAGLSAPMIFAQDTENGFLLLEDLGDTLFSRVLETHPTDERTLYLAATDVLLALHQAPAIDAPDYGADTMSDIAGLAVDWYAFGATGIRSDAARADLTGTLRNAFSALDQWSPVLVLRDYHAENLLWLPDRPAPANVGLLDFQDAGLGHPAYDLMSLARDARREVDPATREAMIAHYRARAGLPAHDFSRACATVSAQRNLRILGVFARLSLHYGKPGYVDLIPRVWGNLAADLSHPDLGALMDTVQAVLPPPTPDLLALLKAKCATIPTPS
jgi:aminoglycoside/choline kinase family phosphotransferase